MIVSSGFSENESDTEGSARGVWGLMAACCLHDKTRLHGVLTTVLFCVGVEKRK